MLSDGARMAWNNNSHARVQWMGMARAQTGTIRYLWSIQMYIHGSQFSIVFFSSPPYLVFFPAQMKETSLNAQIKTNHHTGCKARVGKHTNISTLTCPNDLKTLPMTNSLISTPKPSYLSQKMGRAISGECLLFEERGMSLWFGDKFSLG